MVGGMLCKSDKPAIIIIIVVVVTASVPAGVHWRASPEGMPLWGSNRFWPGSGLVLRCLGPGFTVLALGPGFRPIFIHSFIKYYCYYYDYYCEKTTHSLRRASNQ